MLAGLFAGLSHSWWKGKHTQHHQAPNTEDKDPDIGTGVLAFTPASAAPHRRGWVAHGAAGLGVLPTADPGGAEPPHRQRADLAGAEDRTAPPHRAHLISVRLGGYVAALFVLLPPGKAAAFVGVQLAVFGVLLGASFAPNHKGMPLVPANMKVDFLRRQVLMSRNVRGGRLTDFFMGGLNYQIEHHLFPSMPRPNLRLAQPLVREHCRKHGVAYTEASLLGSYGIVVRYLNRVGLAERDPFTCPLVQQYRG